MTTYNAITDSEISLDAPVKNELMKALKDNPKAIAEGDASAPTTTDGGKTSTINHSALSLETNDYGDVIIWQETGYCVNADSSICSIYIRNAGKYRFTANVRNGSTEARDASVNSSAKATVRVRQNDHNNGDAITTINSTELVNGAVMYHVHDLDLAANVTIFLRVEETVSRIQVSATLSCSVVNPDAMYGVDVRGNLT
jgi:hypothetical protein